MKRAFSISLVALVATLAVITPANAQYDRRDGNFNRGGSINTTQTELQTRVNQGVASGRLTQREAAQLQAKLAQVAAIEAQMRASGRGLSFSERTRLNAQLASLNGQITRELTDFERRGGGFGGGGHGGGGNINVSQAQLQTRINQGIANGRLNSKEAARLNAKLSQLAAIEAQMRASGRGLSFSERTRLNAEIASLNSQITRELNDFEHRNIGYWRNDKRWH